MTVKLFRSYDQALAARKAWAQDAATREGSVDASCDRFSSMAGARANRIALGVTFTTPDAYFSDCWQLWGDGRSLVGTKERLALVLNVLAEQDVLAPTLGTARLVADFICRYAGCPELRHAVDDRIFSDAERCLLRIVRDYLDALDRQGLVEEGYALSEIEGIVPPDDVELLVPFDPTLAQARFLASVGCEAPLLDEVTVPPLDDGVGLSILFPSGPTATAAAIYDEVLSFLESGSQSDARGDVAVAICAPDPQELYRKLSPAFSASGIACGLRYRVPFSESLFGSACLSVRAVVEEQGNWLVAATDFAYNRFSGMSLLEAERLNANLRADRLSSCAQARMQLEQLSPSFRLFADVVEHASGEALASLASFVEEKGIVPTEDASLERDMMSAYANLIDMIDSLSVSPGLSTCLADAISVSVSKLADGEMSMVQGRSLSARRVVIMSLRDAAGLPLGIYDEVVLADVSDEALRPARPAPLDELARKLGIDCAPASLGQARSAFSTAERASRARFACVMPLRDTSQAESYASFPFEEFLEVQADAWRQGPGLCGHATGGVVSNDALFEVGTMSVPVVLEENCSRLGEDDLVRGLGCTFASVHDEAAFSHVRRGSLEHVPLLQHVRTALCAEGQAMVLSPSAIEAYLACPYKWFVERRIRLNEIDEGFSPVEKGSFAHAVYAAYYDELAREGVARMPDSPEQRLFLDEMFDRVFNEEVERQRTLKAGSGRLVAVSENEALQVESLRPLLRASLMRHARLPEGYAVYAHELAISPNEGVMYAGACLNGRVDRVDVNEESSRYVVLDYKGSIANHAAGFDGETSVEEMSVPRKVQALIYAQALRAKLEGLHCAGAVYLSYRAKIDKEFAAGSFDESAYDLSAFAKDSSRVDMSFERFLDGIEAAIEPYISSLAAGRIEPRPSFKGACDYCPVSGCEGRTR